MDYLEAEPSSSVSNGTLPSSSSSVSSRHFVTGPRGSRRNSFSSEPELMTFNEDFSSECENVTNQVSVLARKLNELQEERMVLTEERSRLRTDNAVFQERIHILEEQLHFNEQRWMEKCEEERNRAKDLTNRFERERRLEIEREALKQEMMSREIDCLKKENDNLSAQLTETKKKLSKLQDNLTDAKHDCELAEKEKRKMKAEFDRYRKEVSDKMDDNTEMLEELARQTDQLRQNGYCYDSSLPRQGSLADRIILLEDEVDRLRLENRELSDKNSEIQAQLLHESVACGQSLISDGHSMSLAAELSGLDSNELMNKLKDQEIINQRLRNYINRVLEKIIELHPEILEIKDDEVAPPPLLQPKTPPPPPAPL